VGVRELESNQSPMPWGSPLVGPQGTPAKEIAFPKTMVKPINRINQCQSFSAGKR
jgi:hypothetical protein